MLQALREKSSGWIATIILGMLMIPFAFFGMEQYLFQRNDTFVAKIEAPPSWWSSAPDWWLVRKALWQKEEISADQFRSRFESLRQQQRQAAGENFDVREFESLDNKRKVLESLVDESVMRMATEREGIAIGDAQVRDTIESIPEFQIDGKFDLQRYRLSLASGVPPRTPAEFDQQVRDTLKQQLLASRLRGSAFVTNTEGQRLISLLSETRDVSYAVLPMPVDTAPVTAAQIASWYKAHPEDFRSPEMVTIEYVDIDAATMALPAAADENTLKTQYEQDKARFTEPEQRLTSHILVKVEAGADAAAQKAAEAKANALAVQAKAAGADFGALARQSSEDGGSKDAGGDLGWIAQNGQMAKAFEDAVFATPTGTISGPTKSEFGWHIIQVREIKAGREMPFEQARPELERILAETARERVYNELSGKLVDEVLKSPASLAPAARSANLPVQKLGPFARGQGTGIAANPAVLRAAFSESLIESRMVSDAIEIAANHSVLIRVVEHTPERVQPLDKVGPKVVAAVRADRAGKAAEAEADAALARLKKGESLSAIAASKQWTVSNVPGVPRNAPVPDAVASEAYFQVPVPAADKTSPGKARGQNGQMIVFEVTKVGKGTADEVTPEMRAGFLRELAPRIGEQDVLAVGKAERKRMKVEIAEDRL